MSVRSLNRVMLIGNLTRDPELRYTAGNAAVCTFGLATNRAWKDQNGELKEAVEFHNIVVWGKMAETCHQILSKGMKVYIEGSLSTRSWDDESGKTNYRTEIRTEDWILLDGKGRPGAGGNGGAGDDQSSQSTNPKAKKKSAEDLLDEMTQEEEGGKKSEDPLDDMPF
jgi:single-strand DNA-binding protein